MTKKYTIQSIPSSDELRFEDGSSYELASSLRRIAAYLLNNFILIIFSIAALFMPTVMDTLGIMQVSNEPSDELVFLVLGLVLVLYFVLQIGFIHRYGQTIGKKIMRIQAVDSRSGQRISTFKYVMVRELLMLLISSLISLILIVDWILALQASNRRRSIEDHMANTVVIKLPPKERT